MYSHPQFGIKSMYVCTTHHQYSYHIVPKLLETCATTTPPPPGSMKHAWLGISIAITNSRYMCSAIAEIPASMSPPPPQRKTKNYTSGSKNCDLVSREGKKTLYCTYLLNTLPCHHLFFFFWSHARHMDVTNEINPSIIICV